MTSTNENQQHSIERLNTIFGENEEGRLVEPQWRPFAGQGRAIYQPAVDVAVGPFAVTAQYGTIYDQMVDDNSNLIKEWLGMFRQNWDTCLGQHYWVTLPGSQPNHRVFHSDSGKANTNARCFIALEFENRNSMKHLMGSIVNAGALGRIGILVAERDEVLRAAIRTRAYFDFLKSVGKRTFDMSGVIVITSKQFRESLSV